MTQKESELLRQEECDAIAFFVAFIPYSLTYSAVLDSKFVQFLANLRKDRSRTEESYQEMVRWGLIILKQYEEATEDHERKNSRFSNMAASLEKQPFLKDVASPEIFAKDGGLAKYREKLRQEKAKRYKDYVECREKFRTEVVPILRSTLKTQYLYKTLGTFVCLIPGMFWLINGLPDCFRYVKEYRFKRAFAWFLGSAILSIFSPVSAFLNYRMFDVSRKDIQKRIDWFHASKDWIVTRTYTSEEYADLKAYKKLLSEKYKETINANPSKMLNKPKKHIEQFEDKGSKKVRVFADSEQALRLDRLQILKKESDNEDKPAGITLFFQQLKKSKQRSIKIVQEVHLDHEKFEQCKKR